eukprot:TRINITY_DN46823_c0_g1_i1.p1 TRINITY_DN46823_c0_g1~~TRINITY_DN46823_c0_g1_i1.p1  ORF type:complete len:195 (-),score=22.88 TRINITY_DN46823_c0_g1_i1:278-862(-)
MIAPVVRQSFAARPAGGASNAGGSGSPLIRRGPERFFTDKTSYTGIHVNGGPDPIARKDSFVLSLRAAHHGHQRSKYDASPGLVKKSCSSPSVGRDASARGPERFFYDTNTYTGTHAVRAHGEPKVVDGPATWLRPAQPKLSPSGRVLGRSMSMTGSERGSSEMGRTQKSQDCRHHFGIPPTSDYFSAFMKIGV